MAGSTKSMSFYNPPFGSDTSDCSIDSDPLDAIALQEYQKAVVKEENDLSQCFMPLRLYNKNDDISYLDSDYAQASQESEWDMESTESDNSTINVFMTQKMKKLP